LFDFGYSASIPSPEDSRLSTSFDLGIPRPLLRDPEFSPEVADDELYREMEQALQEQRVFPRDRYVANNYLPVSQPVSYGYSDTDSSSSAEGLHEPQFEWLSFLDDEPSGAARRMKRGYDGAFNSDMGQVPIHFKPVVQKPTDLGDGTKKRRPRSTVKRTKPQVVATPSATSTVIHPATESSNSVAHQLRAEGGAPMTGATTRAEFERLVAPLTTALLMCVATELGGLREGKERVYSSSAGRAPDHALRDPVDGRAFTYRKVVPHQHKPEKIGDPSPRCFACAVRMMHDRAQVLVRQRPDAISQQEDRTPENVEMARKVIISALGLPTNTRVFEYEIIPGDSS